MLIIAKKLHEIAFGKLMEVYSEGNAENGAERFPALSAGEQIRRAEQEFYQYLKEVFFTTPQAVYLIWEENGRYCSALRLEPYRDGLLLEALETAPALRKMGYASTLMAQMRAWLAGQGGVRIYSHVSKRNTASLRTHLSCGFQRILEHAVCADGSVTQNLCTLCLTLP